MEALLALALAGLAASWTAHFMVRASDRKEFAALHRELVAARAALQARAAEHAELASRVQALAISAGVRRS